MAKNRKVRLSFCGECLQGLQDVHWLREQMHLDGTPICRARQVEPYKGTPLVILVDEVIRGRIEGSGLDPRDSDYWERHPASDGNKGYRTWRGRRHQLGD